MADVSEKQTVGTPGPQDGSSARTGVGAWIMGVFFDPKGTFEGIASMLERPHPTDPSKTKDMSKWWLPVLITLIVTVGVTAYTIPNFVAPMQEEAIREAVLSRGGTEADVAQAMSVSGAMMLPMGIVGAIIVTLLIILIFAGIYHLLMKMVGGKGRYRHARAVVAWTSLITALGSLIKLPLMMAKKSMIVETGPSLFFKDLEPSDTLFKVLSSFDIFTIWSMIVTLVALSIVYRTSKGKAAVAIVIVWIIAILLATLTPGGMGAGM